MLHATQVNLTSLNRNTDYLVLIGASVIFFKFNFKPICNQLCVLEQLYVLQAVHENGVSYKLDGSYLDRAIKADFGARSEEWKHFDEKYKWKGECKEGKQ